MKSFVERLKKILKDNNLTASQFAKKINVQRSSVSHILGMRNKPSLDFIVKISNNFKDISLDWLINGDLKQNIKEVNNSHNLHESSPTLMKNNNSKEKKIEKIIYFYSDNTFDVFKN
tara:strand:+ start:102 stop:452 length:351 start_codon:yes stop_codon:yes gene_type:complete